MLYHIPSFRRAVYGMPVADTLASQPYSVTFALQWLFRSLQCDNREVSTAELTRAFGWTSSQAFLQQDVQEMMRVLLDRLEALMKDTPVHACIGALFKGCTTSFIKCIDVSFTSSRQEDFYDIQLDVAGCAKLEESLAKYTATEVLSGDNQYDAEGLGKQDAQRGIVFSVLPPVLTVHLKRFQFDPFKMVPPVPLSVYHPLLD